MASHLKSTMMLDRIEWRNLRLFSTVKTLGVEDGLIDSEELSRCLRLEDRELPLDPQELTYFRGHHTGDVFTSCTDSRQNAGRPVTLVRRSLRLGISKTKCY